MNFKTLAMVGLVGIGMVYGKEIAVEDAFTFSLPDTAKERARPTGDEKCPDTILSKYYCDDFQLGIYRWPSIKASVPIGRIPHEWIKNKEWASVSGVSEGRTALGTPYVTFNTRITRTGRPPYDSVMTVLRSKKGEAYMFQMTGNPKTMAAVQRSIRFK